MGGITKKIMKIMDAGAMKGAMIGTMMFGPVGGIIGGGYNDSNSPTLTIDYVNTASTGNAIDFGDLIGSTGQSGGA